MIGKSLRPLPLFSQVLGKIILIGMAFGITTRTRVSIPVPRSANFGTALYNAALLAGLPDLGVDADAVVADVEAGRATR